MAVDLERFGPVADSWRTAKEGFLRVHRAASPVRQFLFAIGVRLLHSRAVRLVTGSLLRRIVVSNLLGLLILVGGTLYLNKHNAWLIDAKRESLRAQSEIIAAAISANATVDTERIVLDPDRLPEAENALIPFRDDGFAALQLSIRPERVTPILRRLVQPTSNRARIYSRDGTLIADSAQLLSRGLIAKPPEPRSRPDTKTFWTRLAKWLLNADLPVYKEIGNANGNFYPEVRMAMTGTTTPMLLLNENGEQIVSVAAPIQRARSVQGVLLLSSKPGEIDEALTQERWTILKIGLVALAAAIVAAMLLARTVAGPMRRLSAAAEHVSRNISARRELPGFGHRSDEVGQMATAFRNMTTALFRRIEASEKFAADVAHELKNPLTAARSTAEALAYARDEAQRQQLIGQIQDELKRLNRLITDVSNASRLDAELALQQNQPVAMCKLLDGIVTTFSDILGDSGKSIVFEVDPPCPEDALVVNGHEGRLSQVITNLVDNAISFSPDSGTVLVRAHRLDDCVEISVEDDGPGIGPENLEQIFKRFYTYRPTSEGSRGNNSGLGLSISREIVMAHGGEIWAENRIAAGAAPDEPPLGSRFVMRLPARPDCRPQTRSFGHRARRRA